MCLSVCLLRLVSFRALLNDLIWEMVLLILDPIPFITSLYQRSRGPLRIE